MSEVEQANKKAIEVKEYKKKEEKTSQEYLELMEK